MNYEYIKDLLDKYYRGETTPAEDQELSEFFLSATNLPEELEDDRRLFAALADAESFGSAPADLDSKIMKVIDASIAMEYPAHRKSGRLIRRIFIAVSAAAVIALLMLIPLRIGNSGVNSSSQSSIASTKIADTIRNMEIIPQIPDMTSESAAIAQAPESSAHTANLTASAAQPQASGSKTGAYKKRKTVPAEQYAFSEEELKAMEMAFLALNDAAQKLGYAYGCIEESQDCISETQDMLNQILH